MTDRNDLDVLTPAPRVVQYRGEAVEVLPLRLAQLSPFATATRPIIGRVVMAVGMLEEGNALHVGAVLFDLLEQDAPALTRALALATGRDEAFIGDGELAEVVDLAQAVVEVNEDFFARRLPDLLEKLRPAVAKLPRRSAPQSTAVEATAAAGSTSSSTSSPADTIDGTS